MSRDNVRLMNVGGVVKWEWIMSETLICCPFSYSLQNKLKNRNIIGNHFEHWPAYWFNEPLTLLTSWLNDPATFLTSWLNDPLTLLTSRLNDPLTFWLLDSVIHLLYWLFDSMIHSFYWNISLMHWVYWINDLVIHWLFNQWCNVSLTLLTYRLNALLNLLTH